MISLTQEQRKVRNKIEEQKDKIKEAELQIEEYQKECDHIFSHYPNPDIEVKYCIICSFETWK
jgi:predicted ribosome quality control (RQC) complex YloA/Tae2 family protein